MMITTEAATKLLPFTVSGNPCCTCSKVMVLAERVAIAGAGRALPQKVLKGLQPCKISVAKSRALRERREVEIRFISESYIGELGCERKWKTEVTSSTQ